MGPYRVKKPRAEVFRRGPRIAQATAGACQSHASYTYHRNFTPRDPPNAIRMFWTNNSWCYAPAFVSVSSDMVTPNGLHDNDFQAGNPAGLAGSTDGPQGWWNYLNSSTWALAPPFRFGAPTGYCAGAGTNVMTCWYNAAIPVLQP
jgi:hypothetical protein